MGTGLHWPNSPTLAEGWGKVAAMTWHIQAHRPVTEPAGLGPLELEQLRVAGQLYDGVDRKPELRFVVLPQDPNEDNGDDQDEGCFGLGGFLSVSRVFDGERHLYDLWCVDPDAATLFAAGTTLVVAGRCQSTWMTPDLMHPYEHAAALDEAMKLAGIW